MYNYDYYKHSSQSSSYNKNRPQHVSNKTYYGPHQGSYDKNYNNYNVSAYYQQKEYARNFKSSSEDDPDNLEQGLVVDQKTVSYKEILDFCKINNDMVKIVKNTCFIDKSVFVYDISMESKGVDEDKSYIQNFIFLKNIRRGYTLIELYDQINGGYVLRDIEVARKGMEKFFDIKLEFIEEKENHLNRSDHITNADDKRLRKYFLGPILRALNNNLKIDVYKMTKANGEMAQISYNETMNSWVLASKNVCLLARDRNDLELYNPDKTGSVRYSFAYLIGQTWFDMISKIDENTLFEMKIYLENKTFIGEYVGNPATQHLIRYGKITILFYAIVDKYSEENNIDVEECIRVFKKLGLENVSCEKLGRYDNYSKLCFDIETLFKHVAEASIVEEEEGSVLYLMQRDERNSENDKPIVLCKLKTLEYRVYRKLREKLKTHISYKEDSSNFKLNVGFSDSRLKINQYFDEVRQLIQGFKLPNPIEFYYHVAETAFEFANQNVEYCKDLQHNYIDFLEAVFRRMNSRADLRSKMIREEKMLTITTLTNQTQQLNVNEIVELIIYAPPFIITNDIIEKLELKFACKVHHQLIEWKDHIRSRNLIYVLNSHHFKNYYRIDDNKFILFIGFNEKCIKKSLEVCIEKVNNPQFISYNTNVTLQPFINNKDKLEQFYSEYMKDNVEYINTCRKYITSSVKVFDQLTNDELLNESGKALDFLSKRIDEKNKYNETHDVKRSNVNEIEEEIKKESVVIKENQATSNERENIFHSLDFKKSNIQTSNYNTNTVVIIPLTIPGTGKTLFIKTLSELVKCLGKTFDTIGTDKLRKIEMDKYCSNNKIKDRSIAFEQTGKTFNFKFKSQISSQLNQLGKNDSLFYIDKNHPPNALANTLLIVNENVFNSNLKIVALVPDCKDKFKLNENMKYPFSLSYFIQCYMRVKNRRDHETLNGDQDIIHIMGMFFNNFINMSFESELLLGSYQFSNVIKLPFTEEFPESEIPKELVDTARKFFGSFKTGTTPPIDDLALKLDKLIVEFSKKRSFKSTIELVNSTVKPIISKLYDTIPEEINLKTVQKDESVTKTLGNILKQKTETKSNPFLDSKKVVFLGLELSDFDVDSKILKMLHEASELIWYHIKDPYIDEFYNDVYNPNTNWRYPKTFHITSLYIGNDISQKKDEIYLNYKDRVSVIIDFVGIIIVPYKLVACICFPDYNVKNKIPHMTTLIDEWEPKYSNDVLESIFINGELKKEFETVFRNPNYNKEFVKKLNTYVYEEKVTVFVAKFKKNYRFNSVAKYF